MRFDDVSQNLLESFLLQIYDLSFLKIKEFGFFKISNIIYSFFRYSSTKWAG